MAVAAKIAIKIKTNRKHWIARSSIQAVMPVLAALPSSLEPRVCWFVVPGRVVPEETAGFLTAMGPGAAWPMKERQPAGSRRLSVSGSKDQPHDPGPSTQQVSLRGSTMVPLGHLEGICWRLESRRPTCTVTTGHHSARIGAVRLRRALLGIGASAAGPGPGPGGARRRAFPMLLAGVGAIKAWGEGWAMQSRCVACPLLLDQRVMGDD